MYSEELPPCLKSAVKTPNCSRTCESGYSVSYDKDKHFGMSVHSLKTTGSIQIEIMTNGPVEATMEIYEDFLTYKTGLATTILVWLLLFCIRSGTKKLIDPVQAVHVL